MSSENIEKNIKLKQTKCAICDTFDNSVVIYPESVESLDPNYWTTSPAGYNPVLLKFAEEVLGLSPF